MSGSADCWFVRHGPVAVTGLCYGRFDVPLREAPEVSAELVCSRVVERPVAIVTSPLARCRLLALAAGERLGVGVTVDPDWAELDHGAWEGRLWSALERDDGARLTAWMERWEEEAPPGGESLGVFRARVERAWRRLGPGTLVVGHAGPFRAVRVLTGMPWPAAMNEPVPHLEVLPLASSGAVTPYRSA